MDNDEIKLAFENCVKSLLRFIQEQNLVSVIYDIAPKIDFSQRIWYLDLESKYVYSKGKLFELINRRVIIPEVEKCVELMLRENFPQRINMKIVDSFGRPVENPDYRPFLIGDVLLPLIFKYVEKCGLIYNEECFEKIYKELLEYVYASKLPYLIVAPLENFELNNIEEVTIGEYRIRKLEEEEIKTLLSVAGGEILGPSFLSSGFLTNIYCIERKVDVPKGMSLDMSTYFRDIESFITALRLFKHGDVSYNAVLYYSKVWRISYSATGPFVRIVRSSSKYVLDSSDVECFKNFWKAFEKTINSFPNNIKFSLRWFNKSYLEFNEIDRLLDLAIALETLFQTGERLDLYVAHFIGKNSEERKEIWKDMDKLRKIRGAIVHRGYYDVDRGFVDRIEDYYRRSAKIFIESLSEGKISYEDIIEGIKDKILS